MMRYWELLGGDHNAAHPEGKKGENGRVLEVKYVRGDVVPFDGDLGARHVNKFREVSGPRRTGDGFASAPGHIHIPGPPSPRSDTPPPSPMAAFESMDDKTLRDFAVAENIEIKGCKTKADVLVKVKTWVDAKTKAAESS